MAIVPPIVVDEHGTLDLFMTVEEAESYVEAIDVRNEEYVAYDRTGAALQFRIVVGGFFQVELVKIEEPESPDFRPDELKAKIVRYLEVVRPVDASASLDSLVNELQQFERKV